MKKIATLALLAGSALAAHAVVVFDNGTPDGFNGNEFAQWVQAEDVTLTGTGQFNLLRFWAFSLADTTLDSLEVAVFQTPATPTTMITVPFTVSASPYFYLDDEPIFEVEANLSTYTMGTDPFYIAIRANSATNPDSERLDLYWASTSLGNASTGIESRYNSESWFGNGTEHAFQLEYIPGEAVPEPFTMGLAALGLGAAALRRRRR